ncbi:unnamed protein product [Schistosoma mattheei]|uniref:Ig-like domain-containing protein n=1 Tax=Schistosoma mattheei TaxID=31246 RepID=A0AA85B2G4_9TREM|nr:unnamed protein product [Schistosoma mattheei]
MSFTSVILLSSLLLVFSFLFNFIPISSHLNVCPNNETVIYNNNNSNDNNNNELNKCYALQLHLAKQRHIIRLIKRDQFTMNLQLTCHLCSNDNPINFQWYRILQEINRPEYFHDRTFSLLRITSKSFHNLTHYKYCGNIHVQQNRVCFIQIPRKRPIHIDNSNDNNNNIEEIKLIYFILFNGFYEFGQFYDDDDNNTNQLNFWRLFKNLRKI